NVQADSVRILGFTVQDAVGSPGINLSRDHSGYDIENNVIQNNTFGVYFNSNGAKRSEVERNTSRTNNQAGAASATGLYSDQGLSNAEIENNFFTGHQN